MSALKRVAALVSGYLNGSHADMILGKILEGYLYRDGTDERPNLDVASWFVDAESNAAWTEDQSGTVVLKHDLAAAWTVQRALKSTLEGFVDGVILIMNDDNLRTYETATAPSAKHRLLQEVVKVYQMVPTSQPVFLYKGLGRTYDEAKDMYDWSRQHPAFPVLAGSVYPVTWRETTPAGASDVPDRRAFVVGFGDLFAYGFHALEVIQCLAEQHHGGETGVQEVRCLTGSGMWAELDRITSGDETWGRIVEAALRAKDPNLLTMDYRSLTENHPHAALFVVRYRDNFLGVVAMMNGAASGGNDGAMTFATQNTDGTVVATRFVLQVCPPSGHFNPLVRAIQILMHTRREPYPVERTLLTTGILHYLMQSKLYHGGAPVTADGLQDLTYEPGDYPFDTDRMCPERCGLWSG